MSVEPDYIAEANAFRARCPARPVSVGRAVWRVIDTGAVPGGGSLLLCPGTLGNADIFRKVIEALAPDIRVISVTYPMIGDFLRIADGAVALLDRLDAGRTHVLGSSLGGMLTQAIGARHPDRVGHLFVANSIATAEAIRAAKFPPEDVVLGTPGGALKSTVARNLAQWPEPRPEMAAIKRFLADELANSFTGRAFKARLLALSRVTEIPVAAVSSDRLTILQSDDDQLVTAPVRRGVVERYPGAHVHTFDWGGHFPYVTRPDDYVGAIWSRLGL
ncbi:MAG: alpha/beta hydrolase [Rhodospirillaceae bacterium]|nr:alpha/beta hydrolase [Rhodospirillaceae bacterium]